MVKVTIIFISWDLVHWNGIINLKISKKQHGTINLRRIEYAIYPCFRLRSVSWGVLGMETPHIVILLVSFRKIRRSNTQIQIQIMVAACILRELSFTDLQKMMAQVIQLTRRNFWKDQTKWNTELVRPLPASELNSASYVLGSKLVTASLPLHLIAALS